MTKELKNIERIDGSTIESNLIERQLGFESSGELAENYRLKYKTRNGQIISFVPENGDATFNKVNISKVEDDNDAATKLYVDSKLEESNITTVRPHLKGFVVPDDIDLHFDTLNRELNLRPADGVSEVKYYIDGKLYSLKTLLPAKLSDAVLGFFYAFLNKNGQIEFSQQWNENLLPLLTGYRVSNNLDAGVINNEYLSIIADYHGTAMDSATREYQDCNIGVWIESGCTVTIAPDKKSLSRSVGMVVKGDVATKISSQEIVEPSIAYMTNTTEGAETFNVVPSATAWLQDTGSTAGTYYQEADRRERATAGHGVWYLYFVKPDMRSGTWEDVIVPMESSSTFSDRYIGIDAQVRKCAERYLDFISDWKVLGLLYIQDEMITDNVDLASFQSKDLLFCGRLEKMLTTIEDNQTLSEVLSQGNSAGGQAIKNVHAISIGSAGDDGTRMKIVPSKGTVPTYIDQCQISVNRNPVNGGRNDSTLGSSLLLLNPSNTGGSLSYFSSNGATDTIQETFKINENGTGLLPYADAQEIDTSGPKAIPTKEWVEQSEVNAAKTLKIPTVGGGDSTIHKLVIANGTSAGNAEALKVVGVGTGKADIIVKGVAELTVYNHTGVNGSLKSGCSVYRDPSAYNCGMVNSASPAAIDNVLNTPFIGTVLEDSDVISNGAFGIVKVLVDLQKVVEQDFATEEYVDNKFDSITESQGLSDVLSKGNDAGGQSIKNLGNAVDATDALTKGQANTLYAEISKGVNNGNSHDHSGGDGAKISHDNLLNAGTNTHNQIDNHISSSSNPHNLGLHHLGVVDQDSFFTTNTSATIPDTVSFTLVTGDSSVNLTLPKTYGAGSDVSRTIIIKNAMTGGVLNILPPTLVGGEKAGLWDINKDEPSSVSSIIIPSGESVLFKSDGITRWFASLSSNKVELDSIFNHISNNEIHCVIDDEDISSNDKTWSAIKIFNELMGKASFSSLANYLALAGGTMQGDIDMNGNDVNNAKHVNIETTDVIDTALKLSVNNNAANATPYLEFNNSFYDRTVANMGAYVGSGLTYPLWFLNVADSSGTLQRRLSVDRDGTLDLNSNDIVNATGFATPTYGPVLQKAVLEGYSCGKSSTYAAHKSLDVSYEYINCYFDGSVSRFKDNGYALRIIKSPLPEIGGYWHVQRSTVSGTAGGVITFKSLIALDDNGNLNIHGNDIIKAKHISFGDLGVSQLGNDAGQTYTIHGGYFKNGWFASQTSSIPSLTIWASGVVADFIGAAVPNYVGEPINWSNQSLRREQNGTATLPTATVPEVLAAGNQSIMTKDAVRRITFGIADDGFSTLVATNTNASLQTTTGVFYHYAWTDIPSGISSAGFITSYNILNVYIRQQYRPHNSIDVWERIYTGSWSSWIQVNVGSNNKFVKEATLSTLNLDNTFTAGRYGISEATGTLPSSQTCGFIDIYFGDSNNVRQVWRPRGCNEVWERFYNGMGWSGWVPKANLLRTSTYSNGETFSFDDGHALLTGLNDYTMPPADREGQYRVSRITVTNATGNTNNLIAYTGNQILYQGTNYPSFSIANNQSVTFTSDGQNTWIVSAII